MVMENIENTPVKDKKKKKKEKEKDLGEMQVKLLLQWSLSHLMNWIVDRKQFRGGALREAPSQAGHIRVASSVKKFRQT